MSRDRPSTLTEQLQAEIIKRIAVGSYADVAAVAAGVPRSTFYAWMARGRKAKRGRYRAFLHAVRRAEAEAEVQAIAIIRQAMKGGQVLERLKRSQRDGGKGEQEKLSKAEWLAAKWFLERRHASRWARKETEVIAQFARELAKLRRLLHAKGGGPLDHGDASAHAKV